MMAIFYTASGVNHLISPESYLLLIPPYLPNPELLNLIAGLAEVILGIGVLIPRTRKIAICGIIAMLIAFLPAHIYFIKMDSCIPSLFCLPEWTGWFRLIILHPLLMAWALIYWK